MPAGDWLWPAIWLLPTRNVYGGWPRSGEIVLSEARGNRKLFSGNVNVGTKQVGSTLHFEPRWDVNGWPTVLKKTNLLDSTEISIAMKWFGRLKEFNFSSITNTISVRDKSLVNSQV
jgi:hypothetical protein